MPRDGPGAQFLRVNRHKHDRTGPAAPGTYQNLRSFSKKAGEAPANSPQTSRLCCFKAKTTSFTVFPPVRLRHKIAASAPKGQRMPLVRILIADDHAIIRRGLRALLEHEPGFEIV